MIWMLRTGAPWRDLPSEYGPWRSVYTRFSRWSKSGVLQRLFEGLADERDDEGYLIDATIVRAHQDASGARKGGPAELLGDIHDAYVVGDSAYSSKRVVEELRGRGCEVIIPSQPTHRYRCFDRHTYRERRLVEMFFQRIKRFRRISMRFDKLARNYLSFVVLVWLL